MLPWAGVVTIGEFYQFREATPQGEARYSLVGIQPVSKLRKHKEPSGVQPGESLPPSIPSPSTSGLRLQSRLPGVAAQPVQSVLLCATGVLAPYNLETPALSNFEHRQV
jgi:hypothetical protein